MQKKSTWKGGRFVEKANEEPFPFQLITVAKKTETVGGLTVGRLTFTTMSGSDAGSRDYILGTPFSEIVCQLAKQYATSTDKLKVVSVRGDSIGCAARVADIPDDS